MLRAGGGFRRVGERAGHYPRVCGLPEPASQRVLETHVGPPLPPTRGPSGRIDTAAGSPSPGAPDVGIDQLDPNRPQRDVESTGFAEVEQDRVRLVGRGRHTLGRRFGRFG